MVVRVRLCLFLPPSLGMGRQRVAAISGAPAQERPGENMHGVRGIRIKDAVHELHLQINERATRSRSSAASQNMAASRVKTRTSCIKQHSKGHIHN